MQHEALLGFALEAFQSLHVVAGAEGGRDQCLGFTAGEYGTAVSAGKNSSFNPNLADLVEGASIGTAFVIDHLIAENPLAQNFVILLELRFGRGVVCGQGSDLLFFEHANQFVALGFRMLGGIERIGEPETDLSFQTFEISLVKLRRRHFALRLADFGGAVR